MTDILSRSVLLSRLIIDIRSSSSFKRNETNLLIKYNSHSLVVEQIYIFVSEAVALSGGYGEKCD